MKALFLTLVGVVGLTANIWAQTTNFNMSGYNPFTEVSGQAVSISPNGTYNLVSSTNHQLGSGLTDYTTKFFENSNTRVVATAAVVIGVPSGWVSPTNYVNEAGYFGYYQPIGHTTYVTHLEALVGTNWIKVWESTNSIDSILAGSGAWSPTYNLGPLGPPNIPYSFLPTSLYNFGPGATSSLGAGGEGGGSSTVFVEQAKELNVGLVFQDGQWTVKE
jgi:hypothetical protein